MPTLIPANPSRKPSTRRSSRSAARKPSADKTTASKARRAAPVSPPTPAADTSTVPDSETYLRAIPPLLEADGRITEGNQLPALVIALLAFIGTWRPQLTNPVALALLAGIEALLGAVRELGGDPDRQLEAVTTGAVVGLRTTPAPRTWNGLSDHELRPVLMESLLLAMQEASYVGELLEDMESDMAGSVFEPVTENVARYVRDLRRCVRALREPFVEMSKALTGTCTSYSLMTHACNLAASATPEAK